MAIHLKEKHDTKLTFRVSDSEMEMIAEKMQKGGFENFSNFARRMFLHGMVTKVDEDELKFIHRQVAGLSNNINQIARHINETDYVFADDLKHIQTTLTSIYKLLAKLEKGTVLIGDN
jgi:hypothetical protein